MQKIIIMNWKMNPEKLSEAISLAKISDKKKVILCSPFVFLNEVKDNIKNAEIGAQNCFWEEKGAFTGEISCLMLKKIGCRYVIIGHSERRNVLKEDNDIINRKMKLALSAGLKPILCIGETEKERNKKETEKVLKNQIMSAFKNISLKNKKNVFFIIAYEPVWAIGGNNNCDSKNAEKTRIFIKKILNDLNIFNFLIVYGGSVNYGNHQEYSFFDGLLIGGASLNKKEIKKILKTNINCG